MKKAYCWLKNTGTTTVAVLIEKNFWDANHNYDGYPDTSECHGICNAMKLCHVQGICGDTRFKLPINTTLSSLDANMRRHGYELISNSDFDAFCEDISTIYYNVQKYSSNETNITVTSKNYWDQNQCCDDGSDIIYDQVADAMLDSGNVDESCESEYTLDSGETVNNILTGMSKWAFTMTENYEFEEFLKECGEGEEEDKYTDEDED